MIDKILDKLLPIMFTIFVVSCQLLIIFVFFGIPLMLFRQYLR